MKIKLTNISGYHSSVVNEDGNSIKVDNKSIDNPQGVSPMELLLMGVAGCSSIDIISILKKQKQHFKDLTIEVEGEREKVDLANLFKKIHAEVKFLVMLIQKKHLKHVNYHLQNIVRFLKCLKIKLRFLLVFL